MLIFKIVQNRATCQTWAEMLLVQQSLPRNTGLVQCMGHFLEEWLVSHGLLVTSHSLSEVWHGLPSNPKTTNFGQVGIQHVSWEWSSWHTWLFGLGSTWLYRCQEAGCCSTVSPSNFTWIYLLMLRRSRTAATGASAILGQWHNTNTLLDHCCLREFVSKSHLPSHCNLIPQCVFLMTMSWWSQMCEWCFLFNLDL